MILRSADLPDPTDRQSVVRFAASFNGYDYFGSFEACADNAKLRRRETLIDLRNELFFSFRAGNHRGDDGLTLTYLELLPYFRRIVED